MKPLEDAPLNDDTPGLLFGPGKSYEKIVHPVPSRLTVCVDLDGVLAEYRHGCYSDAEIGPPLVGAVEFTHVLAQRFQVVIHTCRANCTKSRRLVHDWLRRYGFAYAELWSGPGKPIASAYVDDRGVSCRPQDGDPAAAFAEALRHVGRLTGREAA